MTELSRDVALSQLTDLLASGEILSGSASGRLRGWHVPNPAKLTLRMVEVKGQARLQVTRRTGHLVTTANTDTADASALRTVATQLLAQPYANWSLHTAAESFQFRFTRKGKAFLGRSTHEDLQAPKPGHDRRKHHLIAPDDPLFDVLGAGAGADKRRQVDAFLRILDASIRAATRRGLFEETQPLTVVDLGCGNAYLTFAAHRYLAGLRPGTVTIGVEIRDELVARSSTRARKAGLAGLGFTAGSIHDAGRLLEGERVDVVLALHACDTATDDALGLAVAWQTPVILAAPCCHHDIQRQLSENWSGAAGPRPYLAMTRHPILRERFADVLTDTLRAGLLRQAGWSTTVSEFVDSRHTPRNAMIRAVRGDVPRGLDPDVEELCSTWRVVPALAERLTADSLTRSRLRGRGAPRHDPGSP